MPSLAESQAILRQAIGSPGEVPVPAMLTAPGGAASRFAIYRRHHLGSLTRHIRGRFPTVEWLLGSRRMTALAEEFVRRTRPATPCMAEYGAAFAEFTAQSAEMQSLPYLESLAALDWHLGDVAVAIDGPALGIAALQGLEPDRLPDLGFALQPGLRYLDAGWPVDDLVRIRLSERPPAQLQFAPAPVALEIRGARGRFGMSRLDAGAHAFRAALGAGAPLGFAMQRALDADAEFDISHGLAALFADGLVVAIKPTDGGEPGV